MATKVESNGALFRDSAILSLRGPRHRVDPKQPYAFLVEPERTAHGTVEDVATIFITNKECPFRCLMCDLWKNTTQQRVAPGSITKQIEFALDQLSETPNVKLYNSGNFFDDQAIPASDRKDIAKLVSRHRTVIVECHPKLVDRRTIEFARSIPGDLEVAMGLETVDPEVLPRLNKRMTLSDYDRATKFLVDAGIRVRAFILLRTPYQDEQSGVTWAKRSIDYAFSIGVACCAVVPTRAGNGVMELLQSKGDFAPPSLRSIESVLEHGVSLGRGRVFMDLWDLEAFHHCENCTKRRKQRLFEMNLSQSYLPRIPCRCEPS